MSHRRQSICLSTPGEANDCEIVGGLAGAASDCAANIAATAEAASSFQDCIFIKIRRLGVRCRVANTQLDIFNADGDAEIDEILGGREWSSNDMWSSDVLLQEF